MDWLLTRQTDYSPKRPNASQGSPLHSQDSLHRSLRSQTTHQTDYSQGWLLTKKTNNSLKKIAHQKNWLLTGQDISKLWMCGYVHHPLTATRHYCVLFKYHCSNIHTQCLQLTTLQTSMHSCISSHTPSSYFHDRRWGINAQIFFFFLNRFKERKRTEVSCRKKKEN